MAYRPWRSESGKEAYQEATDRYRQVMAAEVRERKAALMGHSRPKAPLKKVSGALPMPPITGKRLRFADTGEIKEIADYFPGLFGEGLRASADFLEYRERDKEGGQ